MGCSSGKSTDTKEVEKVEENVDSMKVDLKDEEEKLEEEELNKNFNMGDEEKEEPQMKEANQNNLIVNSEEEREEEKKEENSEEKKSEEIPEDINMDIEDEQQINFNSKSSHLKNSRSYENENTRTLENEKNQNENSNSIGKKSQKKKKKINKKKPFIISEILTSPYKKIKIVLNACSFIDEVMMPIWCPKNTYIKFRVEGKWRIDKLYEYTDSKGIPSNHSKGFNYGALIGRIGNGNKFLVEDEKTFFVNEEGPLYLKQNLPKRMEIEPEGKIDVYVYDADYLSIDEINNRIGWLENGTNENDEDTNNENTNNSNKNPKDKNNIKKKEEKEYEKILRKNFNNIRMNPSMFIKNYSNYNTNLFKTKKFLEKLKDVQLTSLENNEEIYNSLEEYFSLHQQILIQKNLNRNTLTEKLIQLDEDLEYFISSNLNKDIKIKSKITQKNNANEAIIQYLLDKDFRGFIFDSKCESLITKVIKNFFKNMNLIIIGVSLKKEKEENEV